MISRISSFSGPLAKLFIPKGITSSLATSGLILQWEIGDGASYLGYGTSIEDMTTNNTDGVIVGTIAYGGGYLSIQGSATEYVRTGNLNAYLSPATSGTSISVFMWIYPTTNGIILSEEGTTNGDNGGWYDTQIQRNSAGNYLFSVWPYTSGNPLITSSSTYSLNNWHYVGYSYDGTTLRGYVNGVLVGSSVIARQSPGNFGNGMYYYLGYPSSTNMVQTSSVGFGQGPTGAFRFGAIQVYNRGISATEVLNNYNSQKDGYVEVPTNGLQLLLDDSSYPGSGTAWYDMSGNGKNATLVNSPTFVSTDGGYFSLNGTSQYFTVPSGFADFTSGITVLVFADFGAANNFERLIDFGNGDPSNNILLARTSTTNTLIFHMYNNTTNVLTAELTNGIANNEWGFYGFKADGATYKIFNATMSATGSNTSLPTNVTRSLNYIGESNWVGDSFFERYMGVVAIYNRALSDSEIDTFYNYYKERYMGYVRSNLILHIDPSKVLSYPGTGSTIYDLTTNSLDGTATATSFTSPYITFNGSTSKVSIADNEPKLEPGSGDFTMEVWVNPTLLTSSGVILGKFNNGGNSQDVSYSIRTTYNGRIYSQIGNGTSVIDSTYYTPTIGAWVQIVYVWKNISVNTFETYVNGVSIGSVNHSFASILNSTNNLYLGAYNNGEYPQYYNGKIGLTRLYSVALSAAEVKRNFESDHTTYGI
jgi:hypothetical protein